MTMEVLWTIRALNTAQFSVVVNALPDPDLDLSWDDDGSVSAAVEAGDSVAFMAQVQVIGPFSDVVATSYLGGCVYGSFREFRSCPYCRDMIREAVAEARETLAHRRAALAALNLRTVGA